MTSKTKARLTIRSYLGIDDIKIKYYTAPFIIMVVGIAMTIFGSDLAYNLAIFASPFMLILTWGCYILTKKNLIESKVSCKDRGISQRFLNIFYFVLTGLLVSFGHFWLGVCWSLIWIATFGLSIILREERLKELEKKDKIKKNLEKIKTVEEENIKWSGKKI